MSENKTKKINFSEFKSLFDNFFRNKIKKNLLFNNVEEESNDTSWGSLKTRGQSKSK